MVANFVGRSLFFMDFLPRGVQPSDVQVKPRAGQLSGHPGVEVRPFEQDQLLEALDDTRLLIRAGAHHDTEVAVDFFDGSHPRRRRYKQLASADGGDPVARHGGQQFGRGARCRLAQARVDMATL